MNQDPLDRRTMLGTMAGGPVALAALAAAAAEEGRNAGRILMPIGDATEAMDTLYPYFRVQEEGYEVVVTGPQARKYHMVLHEIPPASGIPWDITEERPGYHMQASLAFRDVKPEEYVGLIVSGGRTPSTCATTRT